jgi:hypothetical protein
MQQAITKGKVTGFFFRGRQRRPTEDFVTACVFGGLRYLSPEDAGIALSWLLPREPHLLGGTVEAVELWPRSESERCEPDALLTIGTNTGKRVHLIVEAKWGDYCLSNRQALTQWVAFTRDLQSDDASFLHIFVVPRRANAEPSIRLDEEQLGSGPINRLHRRGGS